MLLSLLRSLSLFLSFLCLLGELLLERERLLDLEDDLFLPGDLLLGDLDLRFGERRLGERLLGDLDLRFGVRERRFGVLERDLFFGVLERERFGGVLERDLFLGVLERDLLFGVGDGDLFLGLLDLDLFFVTFSTLTGDSELFLSTGLTERALSGSGDLEGDFSFLIGEGDRSFSSFGGDGLLDLLLDGVLVFFFSLLRDRLLLDLLVLRFLLSRVGGGSFLVLERDRRPR